MKSEIYFRFNKKIAILLIIMCIVSGFSSPVYAAYDNSQRETIRVGFFAMDGYHMMDEKGNRSGYGYDFLRLMARYLDMNYDYVGYEKSWEEMQEMLEDGDIDLLTSARRTPEREKKFDFSRPIGMNTAILTVRSDNKTIVAQDYSTYNGMKVALLNGNTRNDDFATFAKEKGFTYKAVYFDLTSKMSDALQNRKVDAIVTSSLRQTKNERVIEKFDSSEFYAIVKKGNKELLDKVNYAIDQMNAAEGDWKTELNNRYYENYDDRNLEFTNEEKEVIKEYSSKDTPLKILCDPTRYPYSYVEDGQVKGILPDYFKKLAEYSGISYEFMVCKTRDEYIEHQTDKSVGLCIDSRVESENWPESRNLAISAPYITMRIAMVTRRNFNGNIKVVATVDQTSAGNIEDAYAPNAQKIVYKTRQEAMDAVLEGKADAAFVYYYTAQAYVNSDQSGMLIYSLLDSPTYQYRIIVASRRNHALAGILTKSIYAMPDNLIEEIASQYTAYKASDVTLMTLIQLHPMISLAVGVFLVWILITLAILITRMHARKQLQMVAQQKAREMTILAKQAQEANNAKSLFLSNMSHDIRTPMNAIIGFTNIAKKNHPSLQIQDCLEKIEESSEHLLALINDVLDISRIESGRVKYNPLPVDLIDITNSALAITEGFLTDRNLVFEVKKIQQKHLYVIADPVRIQEILVNILSNAVKYTKDGGKIRFEEDYRLDSDSKHILVQYRVIDTGIGMSKEFEKHIFEDFTQEKSDARTKYQGTGLGLAITKQYLDMMGGKISVKSKKGVGSTFTVEIPLELTDEIESDKQDIVDTKVDFSNVKILMAEDNDLNAEIAQVQLQEYGMKVTRAIDGEDVVNIFKASPIGTFDLILMDIMMPHLNGYEATKAIRNISNRLDGKTIPIIAVTANAFAEDVQASIEAGMNGHLSKPIVMDEVINIISEVLSV